MKVPVMNQVEINQQLALALFLQAMPTDDEESSGMPTMDLGETLAPNPKDTFVTYATDASLAAHGVSEGDMLLVDRRMKPGHNELVIASMDGELYCRVLDMKESCLRSDDEEQSPIRLNEHVGLTIEGVVTQSIRQFR